jgi:hypothetical protein
MPGPVPARCTFPDDFLQEALDTVRRRTVAVQVVQRCRLVLLFQEQPSLRNEDAAEAIGLSATPGTTLAKSLGQRRFFHRGSAWAWAQACFFPRWIKR